MGRSGNGIVFFQFLWQCRLIAKGHSGKDGIVAAVGTIGPVAFKESSPDLPGFYRCPLSIGKGCQVDNRFTPIAIEDKGLCRKAVLLEP